MTAGAGVLLLSRSEVRELLTLEECIEAVEEAFRRQGDGRAHPPGILGYPSGPGGGFHVKAARLDLERAYFAVKINGNFRENPERFGLPAIQGIVLLQDAENGRPLAIADSIEITRLRTAAATAVAARHLARPDARVAALCGCGVQGGAQLSALARVLRIESALVYDVDRRAAERLAAEVSTDLRIPVRAVGSPGEAARASDVCVTCTPSRSAFLRAGDVRAGTFLAAVGADAPEKRELAGDLLAGAKVVVDSLAQCVEIGELHHAAAEGAMSPDDVHAELAEVVAGRKPGRQSPEEITLFDSTGVALEDVAAMARVFEKAVAAGRGRAWEIAG